MRALASQADLHVLVAIAKLSAARRADADACHYYVLVVRAGLRLGSGVRSLILSDVRVACQNGTRYIYINICKWLFMFVPCAGSHVPFNDTNIRLHIEACAIMVCC